MRASQKTSSFDAELIANLSNPVWRLNNLYKIIIKGDEEEEGLVIQFKMNKQQRRFFTRMHHRNIILKARQLGFTTLVSIVWLDTALFSTEPMRCGIIAQDREAAEAIFRDKVKFAYRNLPDDVRAMFPLETENKSELVFAHNCSSIRVATSMRSGTIHRLHISEFGKICAKYPDKAREVATGSIPAVPKSGLLIVESTAEGQEGEFYKMTMRAMAQHENKAALSEKDYRFHFFPWWEANEYELDPSNVVMNESDHAYFSKVEGQIGRTLSMQKRAWYIATRDSDMQGDPTKMWQEYPSTPKEAFQVSTEGCYYAEHLSRARRDGRIVSEIPVLPQPVFTFWDIGRGDMTTIWCMQKVGMRYRFIRYYENSGEDLITYAQWLQAQGFIYGTHYLPHDADYRRMGETPDTNKTIKEMLQSLMPGQRFEIVPRVTALITGITSTRAHFHEAEFCESGCKDGLARLGNYRKKWNKVLGCWTDQDVSDDNAHGADAFRGWGQLVDAGEQFRHIGGVAGGSSFRRRGSPMAV